MDNKPVYKIDTLNFDGPLDLLLQLLEKEKVDIYDIPIAKITSQYLDYVSHMEVHDMDVVSDFLVMATTLLEIKARMLLPKEETEEEEEEDPREELVRRLLEYKKFKFISGRLSGYEKEAQKYHYREEMQLPPEVEQYIPPVDLDSLFAGVDAQMLLKVFREVMKRKEDKTDSRHSDFGIIRRERLSLKDCIVRLISFAGRNSSFTFRQLVKDSRTKMDVVVNFLAVLELMKNGQLEAVQADDESDIEVRVRQGAVLDAEIDLSDIEDK